VAQSVPRSYPYELNIVGRAYRSGTPASGTQTLVFTIGSDTGVHPVTTYTALNYDLSDHAPITFDTLFQPGAQPLEVLNPIVQRELDKRGATGQLSLNDLGVKAYQNFAITDDAVIFFFSQDGLLPHEAGPLQVSVPRTNLASLLA
ncbi:MAG TPA: RsiV family protein, partial [Kribbella sp.]